ncbi:hypothetical protein ACFX13_020846 [Malus domestica]
MQGFKLQTNITVIPCLFRQNQKTLNRYLSNVQASKSRPWLSLSFPQNPLQSPKIPLPNFLISQPQRNSSSQSKARLHSQRSHRAF